jgi:hypothetical protein
MHFHVAPCILLFLCPPCRRMADRVFPKEVHSQLLQLPDPCLLTVLQCCADDLSSLFSAAGPTADCTRRLLWRSAA